MSNVRERVMLDRYAVRSVTGDVNKGDLAVVSLKRLFGKTGEKEESREIGKVFETLPHGKFTLGLVDDNKPEEEWELVENAPRLQFEVLQETSWFDICDRVVGRAAEVYAKDRDYKKNLKALLYEEAFLAGGRILAGFGHPRDLDLTLFNCFVKQIPEDSRHGISKHFANIFEIFSRGGGCGWCLDILRPRGALVRGVNGKSSGSCSWATHFANITTTVEQGGSRRGASLQTLSVWHPDIIEFIEFKSQKEKLECPDCTSKFERLMKRWEGSNVSVMIPDEFMEAVEKDSNWDLVFPDTSEEDYNKLWDGDIKKWKDLGKKIDVYETIKARDLFNLITEHAWRCGDPGILFIDRVNWWSNSHYYNRIICANPCAEEPLPPDGVCNLGHLNLAKFIEEDAEQFPSTEVTAIDAWKKIDKVKLKMAVGVGIKFLNSVTDINKYHDDQMEEAAKGERRVGLGILGLGELLIRIGIRYGSDDCIELLDNLFSLFKEESYKASIRLSAKYGPFPEFDSKQYLEGQFVRRLHKDILRGIEKNGIRNVTVNTIAPTGSIGTMVGTSTGCEPYIALKWTARSRIGATKESVNIWKQLEERFGEDSAKWPSYVVTSSTVPARGHIAVHAILQKHIDASISKTINMPNSATVEDVRDAYLEVFNNGLSKSITVYRDGSRGSDQVLFPESPDEKEMEEVTISIVEQLSSNGSPFVGILRPKINKGRSITDSRDTPVGVLHSTLRYHPITGEPYDFFCESGGGDVGADTEAISRLCSAITRWPDMQVVPQHVRLQIIQDQLLGIRGRGQKGFGKDAVFSLPDGIAKCLKEILEGDIPLAGLPMGSEQVDRFVDKVRSCRSKKELIEFINTGLIQKVGCGSADCECKEEQVELQIPTKEDNRKFDICPACGNATLVIDGGCAYCMDQQCNHSYC